MDAVTHTHLRLANLAKHKPVPTFSFSHLQNFHLFFKDASFSHTSVFSPFASTTQKDEIYDQVMGSLSGQVFQSGCHQFASSQNMLIRIQNGRQTAYNPKTADLQVTIGLLPFVVDSFRLIRQHVLTDLHHLRMCRVRTRSKREASSQNSTWKISHMLNIPYNFLNGFELISKMTRGTSQSTEIHRSAEKSHV